MEAQIQAANGGAYLKFSGFDIVVIEGVSEKPVYLSIVDGEAEIGDAGDLWSKNVFDTCRILSRRVEGKNTSVACIGPAGENLVSMACIVNDEHRAAGLNYKSSHLIENT